MRETGLSTNILFEGEDARDIAKENQNPALHPQVDSSGKQNGRSKDKSRKGIQVDSVDEFWYHIKYDDDDDMSSLDARGIRQGKTISGEFWLSKLPVEKKHVYFHCSSTLAQALTMCIAFRFSCPTVHLSLISEGEKGARVLRHEHIPTNGVVMGVEHDPRNRSLLRMFVEHRNEVLDDMTICECRPGLLSSTIVHQEVYDAGTEICYRLTLLHADGTRQSAVLETSVEHLEDNFFDSARGQDSMIHEPSPRFPIAPCLLRHNLPPDSRIFVYTSVAHTGSKNDGELSDRVSEAGGTPQLRPSDSAGVLSFASDMDTREEDWQSVQGGMSDCEADTCRSQNALLSPRGSDLGLHDQVEWRWPVVRSATLLRKIDKAPFKCFPKSLS